MTETIYALASGSLPCGVAVIRLSGNKAITIASQFLGSTQALKPRQAHYRLFADPTDGTVLDRGLLLLFPGPGSFTAEDVVEFHVHGSIAVVHRFFQALEAAGARLAEAGEFSRRAFENGRLDLTEIEGLSDLIAAETEQQRRQAIGQEQGLLRVRLDDMRAKLLRARAFVEAELDFSDEEDVPDSLADAVWGTCRELADDLRSLLDTSDAGEITRSGFTVAIVGAPNVGKSSLLNALAQRDVAIVSDEAGTTRDMVEVRLNLRGQLVRLIDTAGIRETVSIAEQKGIERTRDAAASADLVIHLSVDGHDDDFAAGDVLRVHSKCDQFLRDGPLNISAKTGYGLDVLVNVIADRATAHLGGEPALVTRRRQGEHIRRAISHLASVDTIAADCIDLRAEAMRLAIDELGRVAGRVDVEDLLDVIFSEFCVGK